MRVLFYIDTPNQLFNCIVYLTQLRKEQSFKADAVVALEFENAEELADKMRSSGLFAHTYTIRDNPINKTRARTGRAIVKALAIVGRKQYSYDSAPGSWKYDCVVYCCPCIGVIEVVSAIRKSGFDPELVMVEDGTGAYNGNVFHITEYVGTVPAGVERVSGLKRIFKSIASRISRNHACLEPSSLYVYRPDLVSYDSGFPIRKLKHCEDAAKSTKLVFTSQAETPALNSNIVLFDVPRYSNSALNKPTRSDAIDKLRKQLFERGLSINVKLHPRTDADVTYFDNEIPFPKLNWEAICNDLNLSDLILVSASSTAMYTPKAIYNKEPYLVILPSLDAEGSHATLNERYLEMARAMYDAGERIFEPATVEETVEIIESLQHGGKSTSNYSGVDHGAGCGISRI